MELKDEINKLSLNNPHSNIIDTLKSRNVDLSEQLAACIQKPVQKRNCKNVMTNNYNKDCISDATAMSLVSGFIDTHFEDYKRQKNEKLLQDHYLGKWICGEGFKVSVTTKPKKDRDGYWSVEAKSLEKGRTLFFSTILAHSEDETTFFENENFYVTGRLTHVGYLSIGLRDAVFKTIKN